MIIVNYLVSHHQSSPAPAVVEKLINKQSGDAQLGLDQRAEQPVPANYLLDLNRMLLPAAMLLVLSQSSLWP